MNNRDIGLLGYSLLGLIQQKPASGYDLRKIFADTPMGSFSDSPGTIYPALRRLEAAGLIHGKVEAASGLRRRKQFSVTPAGLKQLKAWLARPITRDDVSNRLNELMLRFAFLGSALDDRATMQFLQSLEVELKIHVANLKAFMRAHSAGMPTSARLALESGVLGYEAQLRWASHAVSIYQNPSRQEAR